MRVLVSGWKSATQTKARVAWKLVLCCSNRASICSLALIFLSQTRWTVMSGWCTSISLQHFVQTRLDCGSLMYTSISLQPCVSNTFGLRFFVVYKHRLHPVFQTRLECGSLSAHTHQSPAFCFKHVWIMVPCLRTSISLQHFDQTRLIMVACLFTSIRLHPCLKHV